MRRERSLRCRAGIERQAAEGSRENLVGAVSSPEKRLPRSEVPKGLKMRHLAHEPREFPTRPAEL